MPKQVISISDLSRGIYSDPSPELVQDGAVVDASNVLLHRLGKIQSTVGFTSVGALSVNNYESGLYSFRTDDNSSSPTEYILTHNLGIATVRNSSFNSITSYAVGANAGFAYFNGMLFGYPKIGATGTHFIKKAGNWANTHMINYNTQQVSVGVWRNIGDGNGFVFQSGEVSPIASFKVTTETTEVPSQQSTGILDFSNTYISSTAQYCAIKYNEQRYILEVTGPLQQILLAQAIHNAIVASDAIPLTSEWTAGQATVNLTSTIQGSVGNGLVVFEVDEGNGLVTRATTELVGGQDEEFEDSGNIDKVLPSGEYRFAASYVLWDGSETSLSNVAAGLIFEKRTKAQIQLEVNYASFNDFIKGVKFYIGSESFEFSLLAEYNPTNAGGQKRFKFYNESDFSGANNVSSEIDITLPFNSTFQFEAGYDPNKLATPKMSKFLVANNRGFAFGVDYSGNINHDRIIVSPYNKVFCLPEDNSLDVSTEDGDEFVTAEHFGKFLYCFKKYTLYIIDISSGNPSSFFIQSSHFGAGLRSQKAVAKGDIGVFFANREGLYYHNGEQLQEISKGRIEDAWKAIVSTDISVGYDIKSKKALFTRGTITYVFDVYTNSFTKITTFPTATKTGYVVYQHDLLIVGNNTGYKYEDERAASTWSITTKGYDLNLPSVRKKIRRFYLTFSEESVNLDNINLEYNFDDSDTWLSIPNNQKAFVNNKDSVVKNTVAEFDLERSKEAYSVKLRISGTASIEIKTISIVYRSKSPK